MSIDYEQWIASLSETQVRELLLELVTEISDRDNEPDRVLRDWGIANFVEDEDDEDDDVGIGDEYDPESGDVATEDDTHFYQYGKLYLTVEGEQEWESALKAKMDQDKFWPNVWVISDHGNAHLRTNWGEEAEKLNETRHSRRLAVAEKEWEDREENEGEEVVGGTDWKSDKDEDTLYRTVKVQESDGTVAEYEFSVEFRKWSVEVINTTWQYD